MSDVPPPPPGFSLDPPAGGRRPRSRASAIPPPPEGFTLDGDAVDGDTFSTTQSPPVRLYGADAPELDQQGWRRDMTPVAIGKQAKAIADGLVDPTGEVGTLRGYSFGRPVAPIDQGGVDVGESLIRGGTALAAPSYLKGDPRFDDYMEAERLARQNRLGVHGVYAQSPTDYRNQPNVVPDRETVAQWWDSPSPMAGLRPEIEQGYLNINRTGSVDDILAFARDNGFTVDPAKVAKFVAARDAKKPVKFELGYEQVAKPLTNQGDGATGAAARGVGDGVLPNLLDEVGAVPDSLGLTPGRENVFNSDRRWADIWANNTDQNRAIIGYDEFAHPYARLGGEIAGGLVVPFGAGARTVPQLARVGGAYGGAAGFGGGETLPDRLIDGTIGVGTGAVVGAVGGKALEYGVKGGRRLFGRGGAAAVEGAGEAAEGYSDARLGDALSAARGDSLSAPGRVVDRIDIGSLPQRTPDAPVVPIATARPVREGRQPDWIDIGDIPPPPPGFTLDGNAARAIDADALPSLSAEPRQRDYLDLGQRPRPLLRDPTEAEMRAATAGIEPRDVLPIPANDISGPDELDKIGAGRVAESTLQRERDALTRRTVRNYAGVEVPKVGPTDLIGFLRLRGGLQDQGGELSHMGFTNASRRGLDHVGQEHRFGPLVSEKGATLDDAAFAAWEAGYFPELQDRPDINQFLDALRDTYDGRSRRFLPEDGAELEAFDAMRAERYDLERQQSEVGGPIYTDRSVPAGEDAPFAPPEAYEEWPAEAIKRAGNIRLDKLETPQDIKRALSTTEKRVGFDAATRGRVTQAETERLASELGMTPDALLSRRKGQALNAEEALAARQILAKSGNELVNAARAIQRLEDPGDELLAEFRHKLSRHVAIQEQVAGATAEAGRALGQFKIAASSRAVRGDVLNALVRGGGGKHNLKEAANVLIDAVEAGPGVFNAVAAKATKPKWSRRIGELYINFLLSNPATHVVNMTSNTLTAMAQLPEHATAAMIGKARQAFTRTATDRIIASEVGARAFGLMQGAKEGARLFARAVRMGEPSDYVSKVEGEDYKAIPGIAGKVIRVPTRLLTAEDEFFKGIARRMELNGLAARQAYTEGLKGDAATRRIAELSTNPSDELLEKATEYGRYLTFQRKLGPLAQSISNASQHSLIAKLFLPFVRTPTNLLKFAAERSPAAPFMPSWRKEFAAGGARRDLAVARMMLGTGLGMVIYQGAVSGHITGAVPSDPKKARLLRAEGWQEYSIKLGDTYYSYKRLDPFAMTLGVAADLATLPDGMSERQKNDQAALVVASIMGNLASKTWLSGVSDLVEAISDPARNSGNMLERLVGSLLVPAGVAGVARAIDPTARETESIGEAVKGRLPGLRDDLLPRRDIWGEEVTYDSGFLSPAYTSKAKNDPVNLELLKLDYAPGYASKKVGGRELTAEEHDAYQARSGRYAHSALSKLVTSQAWRAMDEEAKVDAASDVVKRARAVARSELFGGKPSRGGSSSPASLPPPPPPPGFTVEGEAGGRNVYADLRKFLPDSSFGSGFRTPAYQADMRRRGYKPAANSGHLSGSDFDLTPPPGKSMGWLKARVRHYDPTARLLDEGDHLHVHFPGYYGAPPLGGARKAGLRNPFAGMPPPPKGFKLDAR